MTGKVHWRHPLARPKERILVVYGDAIQNWQTCSPGIIFVRNAGKNSRFGLPQRPA